MSTFNYARTVATAARLLARFGQTVTLTVVSEGAYDPEAGAATNTSAAYTGKGLPGSYAQRDINGTSIQATDVKLYLSPLQTSGAVMPTPATGDKMTVASVVYGVIDSRPMSPAGTVVLHEVQLRK